MKFCAAAIDYFSIAGRSIPETPSFDQNDVSRSDVDVLLHFLARHHLFIVELVARPVDVHDDDLLLIGEILEVTGIDQSLEDFGGDEQYVGAGLHDFALDVELLAVDGIHGNAHVGIDDILLELLLDGIAQLQGGEAGGHDFADEIQGDLAVGADHVRTTEFGAVVDVNRPAGRMGRYAGRQGAAGDGKLIRAGATRSHYRGVVRHPQLDGGPRSTQDRQRRVRGFLLAPRLLSDRFRRILWRCGGRNDRQ